MEIAQNHVVCRMEVGYPAVPVRHSRCLGYSPLELDDVAAAFFHAPIRAWGYTKENDR